MKARSIPFLLSIVLVILLIILYQVIFQNRFFPGVYIGDSNLTYLTKKEAIQVLSAKFDKRASQTLNFTFKDQKFSISLSDNVSVKFSKSVDEAFDAGHSGTFLKRLSSQLTAIFQKRNFNPEVAINLNPQTIAIEQTVLEPKQDAILTENLDIIPEKIGQSLDKDLLSKKITEYIIFGQIDKDLPLKKDIPDITTAKANQAKNYLQDIAKNPIKLTFEEETFILDNKSAVSLLNLRSDQIIDKDKLLTYLANIAKEIDQPLKEAQFSFDPASSRVSSFQPAQEGRELDQKKTAELIELALKNERPKNISLPVNTTKPKVQTADVNNLGIRELLGRGQSHFAGSIPNRIYNVGLTASKINGVLISPGEIFSFNKTVGDISAATGFKQAYVIKEGRTVLDDGGGVCQDSTTLFRAVLNAGLPVVRRTAHAYRVGYYEQGYPPGLDATVFYPSVDFQFKNDTDHHILIQASTTGTSLIVDLYGTSDNRVATLTTPIVTDQTPPPPELRQDDPTLPKGTVKQIDFPAWGAKVSFKRTVTKNGKVTISETWNSNYKPWQAIYLVGTGG